MANSMQTARRPGIRGAACALAVSLGAVITVGAGELPATPVVRGLAAGMTEARFHVHSRAGWTVGVPGTLTDTTVAVWNHAQGRVETLRLDDIETIEVLERSRSAHSRAWAGALTGAALGTFVTLYALHARDAADCGPCFVGAVVIGVGGGAAAGGLVGLALGSSGAERWVPVYGLPATQR